MNETTSDPTTAAPKRHPARRRYAGGDPLALLYDALCVVEAAEALFSGRAAALRAELQRQYGAPGAGVSVAEHWGDSPRYRRLTSMLDGADALNEVAVTLWKQIEDASATSVAGVVAKLRLARRDPGNAGRILQDAIDCLATLGAEPSPAAQTQAGQTQAGRPSGRAAGSPARKPDAGDTDALLLALYAAFRSIDRASSAFEDRREAIEAGLACRHGPRGADRQVPAAWHGDPAIEALEAAARQSDAVGDLAERVLDELFKLRATSLAGALFRLRLGVDHREADEAACAIEEAETMLASLLQTAPSRGQLAALRGSPDLLACYTALHEAAQDRLATMQSG